MTPTTTDNKKPQNVHQIHTVIVKSKGYLIFNKNYILYFFKYTYIVCIFPRKIMKIKKRHCQFPIKKKNVISVKKNIVYLL